MFGCPMPIVVMRTVFWPAFKFAAKAADFHTVHPVPVKGIDKLDERFAPLTVMRTEIAPLPDPTLARARSPGAGTWRLGTASNRSPLVETALPGAIRRLIFEVGDDG